MRSDDGAQARTFTLITKVSLVMFPFVTFVMTKHFFVEDSGITLCNERWCTPEMAHEALWLLLIRWGVAGTVTGVAIAMSLFAAVILAETKQAQLWLERAMLWSLILPFVSVVETVYLMLSLRP